ncbi:PREDICTED: uncharacterized protein LOC109171580 [Ipomoea nil]|uniref:uncharacterized protein LOC109171580 n=1 Tax=Ipomoea nil TaxID=35883 RepID=UPI000900A979|nr:PREDICTED: uncharacterized protein LOC109171580 [Ipomoea nil]
MLGILVDNAAHGNVIDWLFHNISLLSTEMLPKFIMACWGIWQSRNDCVWNGVQFATNTMLLRSVTFYHNWASVNALETTRNPHAREEQWERPAAGRLKLNSDASLNHTNNVMGLGWVLRDQEGTFMAAKNKCLRGVYTVDEAEAISLR